MKEINIKVSLNDFFKTIQDSEDVDFIIKEISNIFDTYTNDCLMLNTMIDIIINSDPDRHNLKLIDVEELDILCNKLGYNLIKQELV